MITTELEAIRERTGRLVPSEVRELVFAEPEKYPALHERLGHWTERQAWERFIDGQIAEIIRTVRVEVETRPGHVETVRRYISVEQDDGERAYEDIDVIRRSDDLVQQVLKQMEADFAALQSKYSHHRDYFQDMLRRALDE